ncbi:MAG: hypothetical protein JW991_03470 [Candidatus Pacebacteria bacterium]|nr:hypothetical protein [Candidatus Paceibacterota bacterium]
MNKKFLTVILKEAKDPGLNPKGFFGLRPLNDGVGILRPLNDGVGILRPLNDGVGILHPPLAESE